MLHDDIMNFIRVDGPQNIDELKVVFLGIEDGHNIDNNNTASRNAIIAYFKNPYPPARFCPPVGHLVGIQFGKKVLPNICKIMTVLNGGQAVNWSKHRPYIFTKHECQIKFFPVPRIPHDHWNSSLAHGVGNLNGSDISYERYIDLCQEFRPNILMQQIPDYFKTDLVHIIIGARDHWVPMLENKVYGPCPNPEVLTIHQKKLDRRLAYAYLYYAETDKIRSKPLFGAINFFSQGLTTVAIEDFALRMKK